MVSAIDEFLIRFMYWLASGGTMTGTSNVASTAIDTLAINAAKYYYAANFHQTVRNLHDVSGGLVLTLPLDRIDLPAEATAVARLVFPDHRAILVRIEGVAGRELVQLPVHVLEVPGVAKVHHVEWKSQPLSHSPRIEKMEVVSRGRVRRARLFYLRELQEIGRAHV